jgi:hypothetical protein
MKRKIGRKTRIGMEMMNRKVQSKNTQYGQMAKGFKEKVPK